MSMHNLNAQVCLYSPGAFPPFSKERKIPQQQCVKRPQDAHVAAAAQPVGLVINVLICSPPCFVLITAKWEERQQQAGVRVDTSRRTLGSFLSLSC